MQEGNLNFGTRRHTALPTIASMSLYLFLSLFNMLSRLRAEMWIQGWDTLEKTSTDLYSQLSTTTLPSFFQLVHHPVIASANVARLVSVLDFWQPLK